MEAAVSHNSSIKLNFGEQVHKGAPTPFRLSLTLDLFSEEERTIRKSLQERLSIQLPPTAAVLELSVNGNSKEIAEKLNNSQTVKNINETSPSQMNYYALDNKLYVVIKTFFEIEEYFPIVKPQGANEIGQIQLNISSHNDLAKISDLLLQKGDFGLLDSLQVGFEFTKTKIIEEIIIKILDLLGFSGNEQLVKSFKRLNLELNGASSNLFNEFSKIVLKPVIKKPKTEISAILTEANITQAKFYLLNKAFFLKGRFEVEGLAKLIEVLYS